MYPGKGQRLFIIAPQWKQPKCPPMDGWASEMRSIVQWDNDGQYKGPVPMHTTA